tara:strand:- start:2906 stop:3835 length:930 start_codon:yes stop_codon:yes gene_type:complete
MKRTLLILVFGLCVATTAIAQSDADTNKAWKFGGIFNLAISQTGMVNWTAGGENTVSGTVLFKYSADYAKDKWIWDNDMVIGYGGLIKGNSPWEKTDDRIEITTKLGKEAKKNWYYTAFINFRTQMLDGYKLPDDSTLISTWMAPGYVTAGIGMEYKPNKFFYVNISPIASKFTIVANQDLADFGAYGVEKAEYDTNNVRTKAGLQYRYEFGGNITLQFKKEIVKNVELDTKLNFFSNYLENPQNIDVNWDLMLNMKVNKWLSASISTNLIYDHDIDVPLDRDDDGVDDGFGPRTQFKEVIGVGLNMTF